MYLRKYIFKQFHFFFSSKTEIQLNADLSANSNHFYFDYQNGKYGYNTDPNRGAGTFSPFNAFDDVIITSIRLVHSANSNSVSCRVTYCDADGLKYKDETISGSNYAIGSHTISLDGASATISISSGNATSNGTTKNGTTTIKNGYTSWTGNASYSYDVVLGFSY